MRFIPLRALLALVVLPPILYVTAIQGLERYLEHRYRSEILKQIPGNTQALLAGRERLSDHIEAVVDTFMAEADLRHYGAVLSVSIRTQGGRRLYPPVFSESALSEPIHDAMEIASENFALLHEGLDVSLEVAIDHNTLVANGILGLSLGVALGCLMLLYHRGKRDFDREEAQRQREQATIKKREEAQKLLLSSLEDQRATLAAEIETIQTELTSAQERAARNEADLFDEVEALERKLQYNLSQQDRQQGRIRDLEEQLARLAKERQALSAQQIRDLEGLRKRMETLYKNTSFSDRALSGMKELMATGSRNRPAEGTDRTDADQSGGDHPPVGCPNGSSAGETETVPRQGQGNGFRDCIRVQGPPLFSKDQGSQSGHPGRRHQK